MESLENQVYDIVITHFVNPNQFWYKLETNTTNEKLFDLENRMQAYYAKKQHEANFNIPYTPKINSIVAVFDFSKNCWIRAVVDDVFKFKFEDKYILWTIDYGKPLMSSAKFIRDIPDAGANHKVDSVFFGGLNNILPAEKVFDFIKNSSKATFTKKWSEKSIKICEEIINRSYTISFHIEKIHNGQRFGQLAITTDMNKQVNIKNHLIEINHGIQNSENFYQILNKYQLNKSSRWLQSNGNCDLFKYQNSMTSLQTMSLKESETIDEFKQSKILQQDESKFVNMENNIESEIEMEVNEKVKIWREKNDQHANKTIDTSFISNDFTNSYDNLKCISESDFAVVKLNRLADMKSRFKAKQENDQWKTKNLPAGYDLRQLNKTYSSELNYKESPEPPINFVHNYL